MKKISKYKIYRATNIVNGKVYIGYTSNFSARKGGHKFDSKNKNTHFNNSIRKYGWDSFEWDIIFISWDKEYCLEMEKVIIKDYDSVNNGYNMHEGGRIGATHYGSKNGMYGKTHSDETKRKLSEINLGRFKGKSYIEMYGEEKADELKEMRSRASAGRTDMKGKDNPRYIPTIFSFVNLRTGENFTGTRYDFINKYYLNETCVRKIIRGKTKTGVQPTHNGWVCTDWGKLN